MCQPSISKRPHLKESTCIRGHVPSVESETNLREYEQETEKRKAYLFSRQWIWDNKFLWLDLIAVGILMYCDVSTKYIIGTHIIVLATMFYLVWNSLKKTA